MQQAREVFEKITRKDAISWNAIIMGYAQKGDGVEALQLFDRMQEEGFQPVARTFVAAIHACRVLGWLDKGKELHRKVKEKGVELDMFVSNSLLDMYAKCGCVTEAQELLFRMPVRDVVSWTSLISGFAEAGEGEEGLRCFSLMREEGVVPDGRTYVAVFKACTAAAVKEKGRLVEGKLVKSMALQKGRDIHLELEKKSGSGGLLDMFVCNTLVDMYGKCGSMADAQVVFDRMQHRSVVTWTALIGGYAQSCEGELALNIFQLMKANGVAPNALTYCSALRACASLAALEIGRRIHLEEIRVAGVELESAVVNSLISFYSKCGSIEDAKQVFDSAPYKELVTWNALLAGYSYQGDVELVRETFQRMRKLNVDPDGVTFLSILMGCSHAGAVEKGKEYFNLMQQEYKMSPGVEHYTCMVDLLGRARQLEEALSMAKEMPCEADATVWITLLGACRKWKNVSVGEAAFEALLKLDKNDAAGYVLMANVYSGAGMLEESLRIEGMRRQVNAWKKPGQSWWVDSSGKVHKFMVGEAAHPQMTQIRGKLMEVHVKMKEQGGYVPDVDSVFHDISVEEKEIALCEHSERLAIGCALLNTAPGTPIRILKNLRICNDCHTATAILSKVEQRVVTCRDSSRFHVFRDGHCSCGDFW